MPTEAAAATPAQSPVKDVTPAATKPEPAAVAARAAARLRPEAAAHRRYWEEKFSRLTAGPALARPAQQCAQAVDRLG